MQAYSIVQNIRNRCRTYSLWLLVCMMPHNGLFNREIINGNYNAITVINDFIYLVFMCL
jgi:hypothetical protein